MNTTEKIRAYLQGELSPNEHKAFEESLANDAELSAEVAHFRQFDKDLSSFITQNLEKEKEELRAHIANTVGLQLEKLPKHPQKNSTTKKIMLWGRWAASVAAIGLLLIGLPFFLQKPPSIDYITLLEEDLTPDFVGGHMGKNDQDSLWSIWLESYRNKQYDRVKEPLANLDSEDKNYYRAQLLRGIIEMRDQKPQKALPFLQNAAQAPFLIPESDWYIALAYLGMKQEKQAITFLQKVIDRGEIHSLEAARVLDSLE